MKHSYVMAINHGELVHSQSFETERGVYLIDIYRYKDQVYSFKYLNNKLREAHNLSKMKAVKKNGIRRQTV